MLPGSPRTHWHIDDLVAPTTVDAVRDGRHLFANDEDNPILAALVEFDRLVESLHGIPAALMDCEPTFPRDSWAQSREWWEDYVRGTADRLRRLDQTAPFDFDTAARVLRREGR